MKTASAHRAAKSLPSSDEPACTISRAALGRARDVERAADPEVLARVVDARAPGRRRPRRRLLVGDDARRRPSCPRAWRPPRGTRRPARSARRAPAGRPARSCAAASGPAVVTTFQPARPPLTWSTRGEAAGQVERVVVRRGRGRDQPDPLVAMAIAVSSTVGSSAPAGRRPTSPKSTGESAKNTESSFAALGDLRQLAGSAGRRGGRTGRSPAAATTPRGGRCSSGTR